MKMHAECNGNEHVCRMKLKRQVPGTGPETCRERRGGRLCLAELAVCGLLLVGVPIREREREREREMEGERGRGRERGRESVCVGARACARVRVCIFACAR